MRGGTLIRGLDAAAGARDADRPQPADDVEVRVALASDEPDIRALLRATPVEGRTVLSYEREPDYFLGCSTMGPRVETLVARHLTTGNLVALACRAVRPLWVNGAVQDVGYLGHLRVSPRYRGRSLVQRGFRLLGRLDRDTSLPGYLTTIVEGNAEALGILARRPRPGMPAYRERARLCTLVIPTGAGRSPHARGLELADGGAFDVRQVAEYLRRGGPSRQFFPAYDAADFLPGAPLTRGFDPRNFIVATNQGAIVGVLGVWDQSAFKQVVVRGYRGVTARVRPLVALAARALGYPPPPRAPATLRIACASFLAIGDDCAETFDVLLRGALARARQLGGDYLTLALADSDPLLPAARAFRHRLYASRLFTVDWRGGAFLDEVASGVPYVDIASL